MDWYLAVLKKYVEFDGRARRKEYWMFTLFSTLISVGLAAVDVFSGLTNATGGINPLSTVYSMAVFLPTLAVSIRRLHDTNRSGWFLLLAFIPCIGAIILLVFYIEEGTKGSNKFGSDPKGGEHDGDIDRLDD